MVLKSGVQASLAVATWIQLYGVAALCGIGFTMSLFIGSLAFEKAAMEFSGKYRLGILVGSLLSGVVGYMILRIFSHKQPLEELQSDQGERSGGDTKDGNV